MAKAPAGKMADYWTAIDNLLAAAEAKLANAQPNETPNRIPSPPPIINNHIIIQNIQQESQAQSISKTHIKQERKGAHRPFFCVHWGKEHLHTHTKTKQKMHRRWPGLSLMVEQGDLILKLVSTFWSPVHSMSTVHIAHKNKTEEYPASPPPSFSRHRSAKAMGRPQTRTNIGQHFWSPVHSIVTSQSAVPLTPNTPPPLSPNTLTSPTTTKPKQEQQHKSHSLHIPTTKKYPFPSLPVYIQKKSIPFWVPSKFIFKSFRPIQTVANSIRN